MKAGRRSGRLLNQGELRLLLLKLISAQPRHGYDLIKAIEEASLGVYRPSAGVIYPSLSYLEDAGFVAVSNGGKSKKVFEVTGEGVAHLESSADAVGDIQDRLGGARRFSDDPKVQQIRRAMDNLKQSLRMRLSQEISEGQIYSIVDAIDAATKAIERS